MIDKLFATFTAKVAIVALAGGFATGGLAVAGAFSGHADSAHVTSSPAVTLGATTTATVGDRDGHKTKTAEAAETEPEAKESPSATVSPEPTPTPEAKDSDDKDDDETAEADDADDALASNHGHCVSFAASIAKTLGLAGEQKGAFVSLVAQDNSAVTAKVADGGTPDNACVLALAKAKAAALATSVTGTVDDHGSEGQNHDASDDHSNHDGRGDHGAGTTNATTLSGKGGGDKGGND